MAEDKASQPAAAAYADAATPWLPVLTAATRRNPKARAIDTDTLMLRSFHDQVGLAVSFLRESRPGPLLSSGRRGVAPSPSDTTADSGTDGSRERHRQSP